jgi:hypothetical protein
MARPRKEETIKVEDSIQRVEVVNGEKIPTEGEMYFGMKMTDEDRIYSMTNAVKVLPPNMIKNGRHLRENIQALVGFIVTEEMVDKVYENYKHPEY